MRVFILLLALGACSVTAPITGQMSTGEAITGVAVGSMSGGRVDVHIDGGASCTGAYDAMSRARELSIPLVCDSGETVLAQVSRAPDLMSGAGTFEMSDGRTGTFMFE